MNMYYKWVFPKYKDKIIGNENCFRIMVAKEQVKEMKPISKNQIIEYVKEFFDIINMQDFEILDVNLNENPLKRGFYSKYMKKFNLKDKRDIIWMKFTKPESGNESGFLGVVATGCDINFNSDNSSGKIIKALGKEWDKESVLIIFLKRIPPHMNRQQLESGIGNYLIAKNVPILDYYSHNI